MGFARVICPVVIAATLLLLLPIVTVTSEAIKVGNTGISFVSKTLYAKLLVTKPDGNRVLDNYTMDKMELFFKGVQFKKKDVSLAGFRTLTTRETRLFLKTLPEPFEVRYHNSDVQVFWMQDRNYHINEALVRRAAETAEADTNIMFQLCLILDALPPNVALVWENIKDYIITILLARNLYVHPTDVVEIADEFPVICDNPREAEQEFREMLQKDNKLKQLLGDEASAPNTSGPAAQSTARKSRGRPGKGKASSDN
eukprot:GHVS01001396.1.p1 GENE.GHVS01001396.1~~GHVS01001396.1.p1  ORF type:complete len:256 (+),score=11.18 GHVS01001396.1:141-908(+)